LTKWRDIEWHLVWAACICFVLALICLAALLSLTGCSRQQLQKEELEVYIKYTSYCMQYTINTAPDACLIDPDSKTPDD